VLSILFAFLTPTIAAAQFIQNRGQFSDDVEFYATSGGVDVFFLQDRIAFVFKDDDSGMIAMERDPILDPPAGRRVRGTCIVIRSLKRLFL